MRRRDFIKYGGMSLAALVVGPGIPGILDNPVYAASQVQSLSFTITDAIKEMVTHEPGNNTAECYFWVFKEDRFEAEVPGPHIFCTSGDTINITVNNALDESHAFFIPGPPASPPMFDSGPIPPGGSFTGSFIPTSAGTYLYYDNLNEPVNRVMGLHGALVVMPAAPKSGHKWTPYDDPTIRVQRLFDHFGSRPWWPGLAWEEGDPATNTPPFRQYIWLCHQASPNLFAQVGSLAAGEIYPATTSTISINFSRTSLAPISTIVTVTRYSTSSSDSTGCCW